MTTTETTTDATPKVEPADTVVAGVAFPHALRVECERMAAAVTKVHAEIQTEIAGATAVLAQAEALSEAAYRAGEATVTSIQARDGLGNFVHEMSGYTVLANALSDLKDLVDVDGL